MSKKRLFISCIPSAPANDNQPDAHKPDARLMALAELLGRQAARDIYDSTRPAANDVNSSDDPSCEETDHDR
ncbi:hypothetical protein [Emcibacter nanhaiensis]|uniref:hypothetical protein n=1 Tax=Emcibacter nanhaiensis TaxID=1505037 RepID=UPI0015E3CD19|nr:hypothetical protein [Emcibacter nanhaiensis]